MSQTGQNKTGTSFYSKSHGYTHVSAEQTKMDNEFRDTATDLREKKLATSVINVEDSGLDYTMVNLTTIDKIDEELMYRPILNVSVIGRLDNLKVSKTTGQKGHFPNMKAEFLLKFPFLIFEANLSSTTWSTQKTTARGSRTTLRT